MIETAPGSPMHRHPTGKPAADAGPGCHCDHSRYVPRPEFTSRIDATEARTDARIAALDANVTCVQAEMRTFRAEMQRIREEIKEIWATLAELRRDMKIESRQLKFWMVGTGLGVVLGVGAFNATVLANMMASFESGKNISATQLQLQQQGEKNQQLLDRANRQLELIEARTATALSAAPPSAQ